MSQSPSELPTIPLSSGVLGAGLEPAPLNLSKSVSGVPSDNHLTISGLTVHPERARECTMRDVAEPVSFTLTARLEIIISRFNDVAPISAERIAEMVREVLNEGGITVLDQ